MTISYPLSTPTTIGIESIGLTANTATVVSQSPFTGAQQVLKYPMEMWSAQITIPPLLRDTSEAWVAFLLSLKGSYGTFLLGDPNCVKPQGALGTYLVSYTLQVNGAGQTGDTLAIKGLPVSTNRLLLPGDYIQLGSGSTPTLHKVLTIVNSDASGHATLDIFPQLRSSPADGATVTYTDCKGVFRLSGNPTQWKIDSDSKYTIQFDAIEAV